MRGWFDNYVKRVCRAFVFFIAIAGGNALADKLSDEAAQLSAMYALSGVESHLSWVLSTVQQEVSSTQQTCAVKETIPDIEKPLSDLLSVESLRLSFLEELKARTSLDQRNDILSWASSSAGQKIYQAEADSISFDPAQFEAKLATYIESDKYTEKRAERMRKMLAATGAVYFISAVNTETYALVVMAAVCNNSTEAIGEAEAAINEERSAEPLYRSFMRAELVVPSGVVYQDISDEDIDAYTEFAQSDAGRAYFKSLVEGVRGILSERVQGLKQSLESL